MHSPVIVWLRQDLRLTDHAALTAGATMGPVIFLYVLDDETPGEWQIGGASRWWLHRSLVDLGKRVRLVLRRGAADKVIAEVPKGKHGLAEENAKKAIEFGMLYKLKALEAKGYGTLGNIYTQMGDIKNSSINLEKSVSLFVEAKDTNGTMLSSMNLGGFYYNEGMHDKALVYFRL